MSKSSEEIAWKIVGGQKRFHPECEGHRVTFSVDASALASALAGTLDGQKRFVALCGGLPFHFDPCDHGTDPSRYDEVPVEHRDWSMTLREKVSVRIFQIVDHDDFDGSAEDSPESREVIIEEIVIPDARGMSLGSIHERFEYPIIMEQERK